MPRLLVALTLAVAGLLLATVSAAAATDPYTPGTTGYDDGLGQCGTPARGPFGVVAVNSGRPFSTNSCFAEEEAIAGDGGVYVNTGYAKAYGNRVTSACASRAQLFSSRPAVRQAYAIGCSEAQQSEAVVAGIAVPAVWWLDVETANSWSTSQLALNDATLQGIVDELVTTGAAVGVYSTAQQWTAIAGSGWSPAGLDADWVAGADSSADAPARCSDSFTGHAVWLVQYVATLDQDYAC